MNNYLLHINDITDSEYEFYYQSMSPGRKSRVDRLKNINDKKSTVTGEMLLKKHFGNDSQIEYDESGKPFLVNKKGHFSISHSKGLVLVVASDSLVGADIEIIRDVNDAVADKICTKKEKEYILSGNNKRERNLRLIEIWTFKEAYYKFKNDKTFKFDTVDYFDDSIKKEKIITDEYVIHIVY